MISKSFILLFGTGEMTALYIYIYHHHHHIVLVARISLTLSRHSSLSFIALGRSSGQHPVSSHSCWKYVRAGRPAFARPCVGIHKSTSLKDESKKVTARRHILTDRQKRGTGGKMVIVLINRLSDANSKPWRACSRLASYLWP